MKFICWLTRTPFAVANAIREHQKIDKATAHGFDCCERMQCFVSSRYNSWRKCGWRCVENAEFVNKSYLLVACGRQNKMRCVNSCKITEKSENWDCRPYYSIFKNSENKQTNNNQFDIWFRARIYCAISRFVEHFWSNFSARIPQKFSLAHDIKIKQ